MDTKQILLECRGFSDECLAPVKVVTVRSLCKQISRLEDDFNDALIERNNAEKREHEVLGRADFLEEVLKDIGDFAHDRSTGPAVEDALWEVRNMAYQNLR